MRIWIIQLHSVIYRPKPKSKNHFWKRPFKWEYKLFESLISLVLTGNLEYYLWTWIFLYQRCIFTGVKFSLKHSIACWSIRNYNWFIYCVNGSNIFVYPRVKCVRENKTLGLSVKTLIESSQWLLNKLGSIYNIITRFLILNVEVGKSSKLFSFINNIRQAQRK